MKVEDVFERVVRQAELRGAQRERELADERQLAHERALVMRQLERRFGAVPQGVARCIDVADMATLDQYAERLVVVSRIEDVIEEV